MSEQGDFIIKTLRQWADDFSTDEDRDIFIAAADEIASLRAQLDNANLVARHEAAVAEGLRSQLVQAKGAIEDAVDTLESMDLHVDNPLYDRLRSRLSAVAEIASRREAALKTADREGAK